MVLPAHATNKVKIDLFDWSYIQFRGMAYKWTSNLCYRVIFTSLVFVIDSHELQTQKFCALKLFGNLFGIPGAFHFYFSGTRNVLGDNPTGGCLFLKSCHLDTVQGSSLSIIWNPILEKDNRSLKRSRLLDNNHMRIDCRSIPSGAMCLPHHR